MTGAGELPCRLGGRQQAHERHHCGGNALQPDGEPLRGNHTCGMAGQVAVLRPIFHS